MKCRIAFVALFAVARLASAAAIDDIKIELSQDLCGKEGGNDANYVVYATNVNQTQNIDATFKYDSNPPRQHFILFDADLNPVTDRFPKTHTHRFRPNESIGIGCSQTYRAAPTPPGPLSVPLVITKQAAAFADANSAEPSPEDARTFARFILQGGINECGPGVKPPGMLYVANLHPSGRLSASFNLLDDRDPRAGSVTGTKNFVLPPLGVALAGCSNGRSRPGPITGASLEVGTVPGVPRPAVPAPQAKSAAPEPPNPQRSEQPVLDDLTVNVIVSTQYICAGSALPSEWIKVNDAWNPTVCGNPATMTYNLWTIQLIANLPVDHVMQACKAPVPKGWSIVGTGWNPTVCGHPAGNQPNVMAIKRLN
jgi:hypothetical protein